MKKLLIVKPDSLGDLIIFLPSLRYIKKHLNNYEIYVLVREEFKELFSLTHAVDRVFTYKKEKIEPDGLYLKSLLNYLSKFDFDTVIYYVYSREGTFDNFVINLKSNYRITFAGDTSNIPIEEKEKNDLFYDKLIKVDNNKSEIIKYKIFTEKLLRIKIGKFSFKPSFRKKDIFYVEKLLAQKKVKEPFILLAPFAQVKKREWPLEKWIDLLNKYPQLNFVIVGEEKNRNECKEIEKNIKNKKNIFNLCGALSIPQLIYLISKSFIFIGVESAPAHIASIYNIPSIILVGGGHFKRFFPYKKTHHLVYKRMNCFGCNWNCIYNEWYCVKDIGIEKVIKIFDKLFIKYISRRYKQIQDPIYRYNIASQLKKNNFFNIASKIFKYIAKNEDKLKAGAYFHLGEIALHEGKKDEAKKYFKKCLKLNPEHKRAREYLERM